MKRAGIIMFVLLAALTTLLLIAQEKQGSAFKATPITTINPEDTWHWMIGEWEGWSESQLGRSKDQLKFEWDLNNQFLLTEVKSIMTKLNPEAIQKMAKEQNKPMVEIQRMLSTPYRAKGYATLDYQTGEFVSYWFDSHRNVYAGSETRTEDTISIRMKELNSMVTIERTIKRVGKDKMVGTFRNTLPGGKMIEGQFEAIRKGK
jgi:hypothetical protein